MSLPPTTVQQAAYETGAALMGTGAINPIFWHGVRASALPAAALAKATVDIYRKHQQVIDDSIGALKDGNKIAQNGIRVANQVAQNTEAAAEVATVVTTTGIFARITQAVGKVFPFLMGALTLYSVYDFCSEATLGTNEKTSTAEKVEHRAAAVGALGEVGTGIAYTALAVKTAGWAAQHTFKWIPPLAIVSSILSVGRLIQSCAKVYQLFTEWMATPAEQKYERGRLIHKIESEGLKALAHIINVVGVALLLSNPASALIAASILIAVAGTIGLITLYHDRYGLPHSETVNAQDELKGLVRHLRERQSEELQTA